MDIAEDRLCTPELTFTSLEDVLKRKEETLREVRMTREEFDWRTDNYQLGPKETNAYFEMEGLDSFEEYYPVVNARLDELANEFAAHLQLLAGPAPASP